MRQPLVFFGGQHFLRYIGPSSITKIADLKPAVLRIGVAGLGRAFTLMLPTFRAHPLLFQSILAAGYDLGLSLETDVSENRQFCLTNKIFTYLLAGVQVVMSDTPAQRQLAPDLGEAAALVSLSDPKGIATALDRLAGGLEAAKAHAMRLGSERYNWETEKAALLASVETAFARGGQG